MNMGIQGSFSPYSAYGGYGSFAVSGRDDSKQILNPGESTEKKPGSKSSPAECETCKNRKYQDGPDDPGVSFKTPSNIAPEEAAARVRSHENEHVYRNRAKAEREGKEIVSQTVTLKTSVCPECGTPYVSGGQTDTVTRTKQDKRFSVGLPEDSEITGKYLNISA